jgi:hypothetical protein
MGMMRQAAMCVLGDTVVIFSGKMLGIDVNGDIR